MERGKRTYKNMSTINCQTNFSLLPSTLQPAGGANDKSTPPQIDVTKSHVSQENAFL